MNEKLNKTSICSIVFLDIIDYSKKSVSEQIDIKNQFNQLINLSLKDVDQEDRIILDTGDGAAIAHMGSPEDALFVSLSIRDEILKNNILSSMPLYVRFGINLGPVRLVSDINGQRNIIGDGINTAQRIMSFAKPNQIVVSRSYYDVTSRLTQEISQMFDYSGIKHDKHVREHEIYAVRLLKDSTAPDTNSTQLNPLAQPAKQLFNPLNWFTAVNWKYTALALPAFVTFVMIIKSAAAPQEPMISFIQNAEAVPATLEVANNLNAAQQQRDMQLLNPPTELSAIEDKAETNAQVADVNPITTPEKAADKSPVKDASVKTKSANKKVSKQIEQAELSDLPPEFKAPVSSHVQTTKIAANTPDLTMKPIAKTEEPVQKSGWKSFTDSVKKGQQGSCTQVQISMNQCQQ